MKNYMRWKKKKIRNKINNKKYWKWDEKSKKNVENDDI